jgi:D-arabinose 1-dehydrogenase-like Zn-dependent alcohol dehydrogenase
MNARLMRAMRLHRYGQPLKLDAIPIPKVSGEGVLIRVKGAGICHYEIHSSRGEYSDLMPLKLPFTYGHEVTGVVEEVGSNVEGFTPGDSVGVYFIWGCGVCRFCRSDLAQICPTSVLNGLNGGQGGYAEYMHVPSYRFLVGIKGLDFVQAAAMQCAGLTAYSSVRKVLNKLYPGSYAAVVGVGGVGHLVIQCLKVLSPAKVIAIDIAEDKLKLAKRLGADYRVNSKSQNPVEEVQKITGGRGVDSILDLVAVDSTLESATGMLGRHGKLVVVGGSSGTLHLPATSILLHMIEVVGNHVGSYNELQDVVSLLRAGKLQPLITRYKLEEANEALDTLRKGEITGRAVLVP